MISRHADSPASAWQKSSVDDPGLGAVPDQVGVARHGIGELVMWVRVLSCVPGCPA
jgi:hypothetical protein